MAETKEISIVITAKNLSDVELEKARRAIAGLKRDSDDTTTGTKSWTDAVMANATGYLTGIATWETAKAVLGGLFEMVKSGIADYIKEEQTVNRLTMALQRNGLEGPKVAASYVDMAEALERQSTFSHDAIIEAEALFTQLGGVGPEMMGRALQAAMDLSAALGTDLPSSVMLLSKAYEGNYTALAKHGIIIDQAKLATEGFQAVLDAVEQKMGGSYSANAATLQGEIEQLSNQFDRLKESIGGIVVEMGSGEMIGAIARLADLASTMIAARPAIESLFLLYAMQRSPIDAWNSLYLGPPPAVRGAAKFGATQFQDFHTSEFDLDQAAKALNESLATQKKAIDAAAEAAKKAAEKYKELQARVLAKQQHESFWGWMLKEGQQYTAASEEWYLTEGRLQSGTIRGFEGMAALLPPIQSQSKAINQSLRDLDAQPWADLASVTDVLAAGLDEVDSGLARAVRSAGRFFDEMARAKQAGSSLGETRTAVVAMTATLDAMVQALVKTDSNLGNFLRTSSSWANMGASAGGGWGALAGGIIGGLIALSDNSNKRSAGIAAERTALVSLRDELTKTHGSVYNLDLASRAFGLTLVETTRKALDGDAALWQVQAQAQALDERLKALTATLAKYNLTWGDTSGTMAEYFANVHADELTQSFSALTAAGVPADRVIAGMSNDLNSYIIAAYSAGQKVPAGIAPMIDSLIRAGQVSEAAARAMLGLDPAAAVPAWADLQSAMERYGLTAEQLGKGTTQIKVSSQAEQFAGDWTLFQAAGADMGTAMQAMIDKGGFSDMLKNVLEMGLTLPASMKPMMQAMAEAGKLTDKNGKLLDLTNFTFEETYAQSTANLIAALQANTAAIVRSDINQWNYRPGYSGASPGDPGNGTTPTGTGWGAGYGIGAPTNPYPGAVQTPLFGPGGVFFQPKAGSSNPGMFFPGPFQNLWEDEGVQNFADGSGGVRDFGRGTPAMLHGLEAVVTAQQIRQLLRGRSGSRSSGPIQIEITTVTQMNDRELSRSITPVLIEEINRYTGTR